MMSRIALIALMPALLLAPLSVAPLAALAEEAAPAAAPAAPNLPAITVSTVGTRLMRDRVLASGFVGAVERVQVQPLIEGQPIEALLADVGDSVAQGQVLARLSATTMDLQNAQFQASLAAARATVAQTEAQLLEAQESDD